MKLFFQHKFFFIFTVNLLYQLIKIYDVNISKVRFSRNYGNDKINYNNSYNQFLKYRLSVSIRSTDVVLLYAIAMVILLIR